MTPLEKQTLKNALLDVCNTSYTDKNYKKRFVGSCIEELKKKLDLPANVIIKMIQELYLTSDTDFRFEFIKGRKNNKITAFEPFKLESTIPIENIKLDVALQESHIIYLLNQFYGKISEAQICKIALLYSELVNHANQYTIYMAICKNSTAVYDKLANKFSHSEVDEILNLIAEHGYSYIDNGILYWKIYSPKLELTSKEIEESFSVISQNEVVEEKNKEEEQPVKEINTQPVETVFTAKDALYLIAKEFGMTLTENDAENKLNELIATTTELINDFNEMPDWEKLRNWDKFMEGWSLITGEILNDRN